MKGIEFTERELETIRRMWADPANSVSMIARAVRRSKNSVMGKITRLGLPLRGSCVRQPGDGSRPEQVRRSEPSAPPSLLAIAPLPIGASELLPPLAGEKAPSVPGQAVPDVPRRLRPPKTCAWPLGDPGTRGFHSCDAPVRPGKPYCPAHCDLAFVPIRDRARDHHPATADGPG